MKLLNHIIESYNNFPEKHCFNIEGNVYTYKEFALRVSALKHLLQNTCQKEKLVGIIANNDIETYVSIYAALFTGLGYVPINPSHPIERSSSIIQQAELKFILVNSADEKIKELAGSNNANLILTEKINGTDIDLGITSVDENEIAYVLFTSGSTGVPKGVQITRKNLDSFIDAFFDLNYKIDENDRFLQMFELTFDFSVICYTIPLCIGACIYTVSSEGVKYANIYNVIEENEITFACLVPSILSYLRPYFEEIKFEKMKYCLFCGEALYLQIVDEWQKCNPNALIINAYGPTEATVFCLIYNCNKAPLKTYNEAICIGIPMKDTLAICVDENLKPVPPGTKGELCLAGQQLTPGYWKNPEKNIESFFKHKINNEEYTFYRTGDLALIDDEGDFLFSGRIDFQVKIDGFRIELGEIESKAREICPGCNAAAVPYQSKIGTTKIHLFIEGYSGDITEVENQLKQKLPQYMVPATASGLNSFPLNQNGKTDRKALVHVIP